MTLMGLEAVPPPPSFIGSSAQINGAFRRRSDAETNLRTRNRGAFLFLLLGLQPHSHLSTPNILHSVKAPIKICFSLRPVSGRGREQRWKETSRTSHSSLTLSPPPSSDGPFSCRAKHVILLYHKPQTADGPEVSKMVVYFIYHLQKEARRDV